MNCNLKNKVLSVIALLFAVTITANNTSFAADTPSTPAKPVAEAAKPAVQNNGNAVAAQKVQQNQTNPSGAQNAKPAIAPANPNGAPNTKPENAPANPNGAPATAAGVQDAAQQLANEQEIKALSAEEQAAMDSLKELDAEIAAVREELRILNSDLETEVKTGQKTPSASDDLDYLDAMIPSELDELLPPRHKLVTSPVAQPNANPAGQPNANPNGQPNANPTGQPNVNPNGQQVNPDGTPANPNAAPLEAGAGNELSAAPNGAQPNGQDPNAQANIPNADAPKSPLESFGNAILAKVDNNLFNKMSTIEKQTTLLRLEYKREELKNKVAALRTARLRAMEEEVERRRAYEEKLKNAEAERQAKILEEQRKLKEREMELEKLRQARVLNEYMNEMLQMNQKWIEENTKLQNRIHELEDERVELINDFKAKIEEFGTAIDGMKEHVILAVKEHFTVVNTLRAKIAELEDIIVEKEAQIKSLKEALENPFGESEESGPSQLDVDLSQEYAIMDITGQGDDIVAKLVNVDGTTFTVHKGSMLKGGEVVSAITDTYISFESKGVKSYLYTGGSVREYEPQATFNDGSEDFFEQTDATTLAKAKLEANAMSGDNKASAKDSREKRGGRSVVDKNDDEKNQRQSNKVTKKSDTKERSSSDNSSSSSAKSSSRSSGAPVSSRSMFAR